jgi:hypothetical protein
VCPVSTFEMIDFHEFWYELYATEGHPDISYKEVRDLLEANIMGLCSLLKNEE